jgi:uncharacterized protein (TIGR02145 family)
MLTELTDIKNCVTLFNKFSNSTVSTETELDVMKTNVREAYSIFTSRLTIKEILDSDREYNQEQFNFVKDIYKVLIDALPDPIIIPPPPPPPVFDLKDIDGNIYTTVVIGTQEWIIENLSTTKYADGTPIPNLSLDVDWGAEDGSMGHDGAYCYCENNIVNKTDYGALYNWYAINNSKGLAYFERGGLQEIGWRVSGDTDFDVLVAFLGGDTIAGGKLKESGLTHWDSPNDFATNETGFSARGTDVRDLMGNFGNDKSTAILWSSTGYADTLAWRRDLQNVNAQIHRYGADKRSGFVIRCVKDI